MLESKFALSIEYAGENAERHLKGKEIDQAHIRPTRPDLRP